MQKQVMKRAVELAKKMVGDWIARMALALRQAWKEAKTLVANERGSVGRELAQLKGSKKQIAWAEDIRKKAIEEIQNVIEEEAEWIEKTNYEEEKARVRNNVSKLEVFLEKVKAESDSTWFINNRDKFNWQYEIFYMAGIEED